MCEATMANNVWVLCMGKICPWKIPGTSIRSLKILASHSAIPWQSRFRQPVWNFGLPSGNRTKRSNQRWPTVAHTVVVHEQSSVQPEFSRTWETTSHVCQGGQVAAGDQNGNERFYFIFHHITIRYIKKSIIFGGNHGYRRQQCEFTPIQFAISALGAETLRNHKVVKLWVCCWYQGILETARL